MKWTYLDIAKLNRNLNFIVRKIKVREKEFLKKSGYDITHRELEYVAIINDFEGSKLKDALKTLDVSKSTWSNQLKILVKKKIIILKQDLKDKRTKIPKLTNYGKNIYNVYKEVRKLFLKKYSKYLHNEEIETLFEIFKKLIFAIKENNR